MGRCPIDRYIYQVYIPSHAWWKFLISPSCYSFNRVFLCLIFVRLSVNAFLSDRHPQCWEKVQVGDRDVVFWLLHSVSVPFSLCLDVFPCCYFLIVLTHKAYVELKRPVLRSHTCGTSPSSSLSPCSFRTWEAQPCVWDTALLCIGSLCNLQVLLLMFSLD